MGGARLERATSCMRREGDADVLDFYEPEEVMALARAAREGPVAGEQDSALCVVIEDVEKALSNASKRHRECDKRREHGQELRRRQHIEVRLKVK